MEDKQQNPEPGTLRELQEKREELAVQELVHCLKFPC